MSPALKGCRPKIMAFDRAVTVNDTSELVADRDYAAVDGFCMYDIRLTRSTVQVGQMVLPTHLSYI